MVGMNLETCRGVHAHCNLQGDPPARTRKASGQSWLLKGQTTLTNVPRGRRRRPGARGAGRDKKAGFSKIFLKGCLLRKKPP